MKILLVCYHFQVCLGVYAKRAFKALGCDVRSIGTQADVAQAWGINRVIKPEYAFTPDGDLAAYWDDWTPDLIIIADTSLRGYLHPRYTDVTHVVWTVDNHVRDVSQGGVAAYFLAHLHSDVYPVDESRKDHIWLPCATDSELFPPSQIAWSDREFDAALVGVMYPKRAFLIDLLRAAGLNVFADTGLLFDEYRAVYQNTRFSLCESAAGDVPQRVFETAGMGCHVVMDYNRMAQANLLNSRLGFYGFSVCKNPQSVVNHILELTKNPAYAVANTLPMQKVVLQQHTWKHRAQVILDWYAGEKSNMAAVEITAKPNTTEELREEARKLEQAFIDSIGSRKPYLNVGSGRVILPAPKPAHHHFIPDGVHTYPLWVNADRVAQDGVDCVADLFTYPWPFEDNSFDGAIISHVAEHIPHEIRLNYPALEDYENDKSWELTVARIKALQDGFFAFFQELWRVLTPGAIAHVIAPYGQTTAAFIDPTHTRHLFPHTFAYLIPSADAPFEYNIGTQRWEYGGNVQQSYSLVAERLLESDPMIKDNDELWKQVGVQPYINRRMQHYTEAMWNIITDFYIPLKVVK